MAGITGPIASRWDSQGLPYGAPQEDALLEPATFAAEVKAVAPPSRIAVPRHFETVMAGRHRPARGSG